MPVDNALCLTRGDAGCDLPSPRRLLRQAPALASRFDPARRLGEQPHPERSCRAALCTNGVNQSARSRMCSRCAVAFWRSPLEWDSNRRTHYRSGTYTLQVRMADSSSNYGLLKRPSQKRNSGWVARGRAQRAPQIFGSGGSLLSTAATLSFGPDIAPAASAHDPQHGTAIDAGRGRGATCPSVDMQRICPAPRYSQKSLPIPFMTVAPPFAAGERLANEKTRKTR